MRSSFPEAGSDVGSDDGWENLRIYGQSALYFTVPVLRLRSNRIRCVDAFRELQVQDFDE